MIKNVIFNKSKNAELYVSSFICLLCVCNFSLHLKKRFWIYMYLGECPKIEYGRHFHGNQPREICCCCVFSIFFHTDHNIYIYIQWNDWVEKWAKQFFDQPPPPLNTAEWSGLSWSERKFTSFEMVAKGIWTWALSIASLAFYVQRSTILKTICFNCWQE